jgi:glycosyltransferase involved in cell wall biosynthesis
MVARQHAIYERATGVFTMSHWFARSLVEESGLPPSKIHVIHPGINTPKIPEGQQGELRARQAPRRKLLFVGRMWDVATFYRKGGDLVIDAFSILRKEYDPELTLTMAGVPDWPLPGPVPDGVSLPGVLSPAEVQRLYDAHDLLVVPSRMDGFGIVFAEAASRGLPCVARNAYAMPEVVVPGLSGELINDGDPQELASVIVKALADDQLYETCLARAPRIAEYFSWGRAAWEIRQIIGQTIFGSRRPDNP